MRILIAEDDRVIADGLLRALRASGAAVDHVSSGTEADAALMTNKEFDLLILDLGLPKMHGLEVLRKLRARGSSLPVLILTAADSVEERVKGLDFGADDYMAKPFSLQEMEARVRALVRRRMGGASDSIRHGPLVYDQAGRVASIDGKMIDLSARELGLLEVLLQRAGRMVSKDQLVERLCEWGDEVSNNAIEVYIHRLRKKIEKGPIRIATVRGLGYLPREDPGLTGSTSTEHPREDLPVRTALAVWRDPGLDAHATAAAVADQPGADLAGGAKCGRQAVRPGPRVQRGRTGHPGQGQRPAGAVQPAPAGPPAAACRRRGHGFLPDPRRPRRIPRRRTRSAPARRRRGALLRRGAYPRRRVPWQRCPGRLHVGPARPCAGQAGAGAGRREPGQTRRARDRDRQGRDVAAVRHPAPCRAAGVGRPGLCHQAAQPAGGAHPRAPARRPEPAGRALDSAGGGATGGVGERPADAAQELDQPPEALSGRRRTPAQDAAGRTAHAGRPGAARRWQRRRTQAVAAPDRPPPANAPPTP